MQFHQEEAEEEDTGPKHHSHIAGPRVSRDGCTVGRFNLWVVRDQNRASAEQLKEQKASLKQRDAQASTTGAEARKLRTFEQRQQQLRAEQAHKAVRERYIAQSSNNKKEVEEARRTVKEAQQAYLDEQKKSIKKHGEVQRKKTLDSQRAAFEAKTALVMAQKAEHRARVDKARAAKEKWYADKKAEHAVLRKELSAAGLQGSGMTIEVALGKQFFINQKREAAASVKAICSDAKREKEKHTKQNAKANQMAHNAIYDTRNNASQKRAVGKCEDERQVHALGAPYRWARMMKRLGTRPSSGLSRAST